MLFTICKHKIIHHLCSANSFDYVNTSAWLSVFYKFSIIFTGVNSHILKEVSILIYSCYYCSLENIQGLNKAVIANAQSILIS